MQTPADALGPPRSPQVQVRGQKEPSKSFPIPAGHSSLLISHAAASRRLRRLEITPAQHHRPFCALGFPKDFQYRATPPELLTYVKRARAFRCAAAAEEPANGDHR